MPRMSVFEIPTSRALPLLKAKVLKKGRTEEEFTRVVEWLTGYNETAIEAALESDVPYGDFFSHAPELNPSRALITGKVCDVAVEAIEDPLMREIRYLGKLVDEFAKGRSLQKILRA